jgi:hypothetical protein
MRTCCRHPRVDVGLFGVIATIGRWAGPWQDSRQEGAFRLAVNMDRDAGGEITGFNGSNDRFQGLVDDDGNLSLPLTDASDNPPFRSKIEKHGSGECKEVREGGGGEDG